MLGEFAHEDHAVKTAKGVVGDEDVSSALWQVLNTVGTVGDAHVSKGRIVEGCAAKIREIAQDVSYAILVRNTFEVTDHEAGEHPLDLRVLVSENLLDIQLKRFYGLFHFVTLSGCKDSNQHCPAQHFEIL